MADHESWGNSPSSHGGYSNGGFLVGLLNVIGFVANYDEIKEKKIKLKNCYNKLDSFQRSQYDIRKFNMFRTLDFQMNEESRIDKELELMENVMTEYRNT